MRKINRHIYRAIFVCLLLLVNSNLIAQDDSTKVADTSKVEIIQTDTVPASSDSIQLYRINGRYLKSYWTSFKGVVQAPGRWDGGDWIKFGVVAGSVGIMFGGLDRPVNKFFKTNTATFWDGVEDVFYPLGNRVPPLIISGMYVAGLVTKNRKLEHSSLMMAKSLAISTIFYTSTKALIRRQRPDKTDNPHDFTTQFRKNDYTSFPSGHANTAFSLATAFAMQYKHKKWVAWVAYSLATLTSLSRIYQDRHWPSDVIIGASIGHFVTRTIYRLEERKTSQKKKY